MNIEDAPFSRFIIGGIRKSVTLLDFYLKHIKVLNYAFVCGIVGVIVNYVVYHCLLWIIWEPAAFYMGVGVAAFSNYAFTRGPLDHLFFESVEPVAERVKIDSPLEAFGTAALRLMEEAKSEH